MFLQGYEININASSVDVKRDDFSRSKKNRALTSILIIAAGVLLS